MELNLYLKVIGVTLVLVGVFLVASHFLRRRFGTLSAGGRQIRVKEAKSLGLKAQLLLVKVKDREFLLGLSDKGISVIKEWESDEED